MSPREEAGRCRKGTFNGAAAEASQYGFARCIKDAGHSDECDSGPAPDPEPDELPRAA